MPKGLYIVDPISRIYTLDPATGSPNLIGPVGMTQVTDITFHGPTLYGISFSQLIKINPATGAGTTIGPTGFNGTNGLAAANDGTLYASGGSQLLRLNPVTGAATAIGSFGAGLQSNGDLAFDSNGNLFGALSNGSGPVLLASINTSTGNAIPIGSTGLTSLYGLAFHCCRLYGATATGELVEINAATGKATVIGKNTLTQWGMASRACCC